LNSFRISQRHGPRGIHLKQLKSTDLHAIGVLSDNMGETAGGENEWPLSLLAEADPVLSRTLPATQTQPPPVRRE